MPKYKYDATTLAGESAAGVIEAESLTRARNMLLAQDLQLTKLEEKKSIGEFELTARRIKGPELMLFSRQLGAFVRSGIPVLTALDRYEQVAIYESPIMHGDLEGYRRLRRQITRPLALHFDDPPFSIAQRTPAAKIAPRPPNSGPSTFTL